MRSNQFRIFRDQRVNNHQIICFLYFQLEWHLVANMVGRSLQREMPSLLAVLLPCATVFHLSLETNKWPINSWHLCLYVQLEWITVAHGSATAGGEGISICKLLPTICATVCHSSWMYKKQMIWCSFTSWSLKIWNWFDLTGQDFEQIYLGIKTESCRSSVL